MAIKRILLLLMLSSVVYPQFTGNLARKYAKAKTNFFERVVPTSAPWKVTYTQKNLFIYDDMSDYTVAKFPREWVRLSGTHLVAQLSVAEGRLEKNAKYINCTSAGSIYFPTNTDASSYYISFEYYTAGAWVRQNGLVSALSTSLSYFDYSATTRKLTFIMGANDRLSKVKVTLAAQ